MVNLRDVTKDTEPVVTSLSSIMKSYGTLDDVWLDEGVAAQWRNETKARLDGITLRSLWFDQVWVYILCHKIAEPLSMLDWCVVQDVQQDSGDYVAEPAPDHPIQLLLENPNPLQDEVEFKYTLFTDYILMGNSTCFYSRSKGHLTTVPPEFLAILFDAQCMPEAYMIESDVYSQCFNIDQKVKIPVKDMLHITRPNPRNPVWGHSPFVSGSQSVLLDRYSKSYLVDHYQKNALPSLIVESDRNPTREILTRTQLGFEQLYTGRRNQRKPAILPKGMTVKELTNSIADQNLIDVINQNREEIIQTVGVPKHVIGLQESGSLGSEEHKAALRYFWTDTLIPIANRISANMTQFFAKQLGEGFRITLDYSDVALLREDHLMKAQLAREMLATHTVNEVRAEVYELEPIEGGDVIPALQQAMPQFPSFAPPPRAPNPPAPPEPEEEPEQDEEEQRFLAMEEGRRRCERIWKAIDSRFGGARKAETDSKREEQQRYLDALGPAFQRFAEATLEVLRSQAKDKSLTKAGPSKRNIERMLKNAYRRLRGDYKEDVIPILSDGINAGYQFATNFVLNEQDRQSLEALRQVRANMLDELVDQQAESSYNQIADTTAVRISQEISRGLQANESVQQIGDRLAKTFETILGPDRATLIAIQEINTIQSLGTEAMAQDFTEVVGEENVMKVWLNSGDSLVRGNPSGDYPDSQADHWSIAGKMTPVNEPFENGLMFPLEPGAPAREVMRCRCEHIVVDKRDSDFLNQ